MIYGSESKYLIITLTFLSALFFKGMAQTNMAFYTIEQQFNSSSFNPAFLASDSQYSFSIFPLTGNFGFNNQKVIKELGSKLLTGINEDDQYLAIVERMVDHSSFNQNLEIDFLNFTYRSAEGFFNFRIRENISFSASIKGPVSEFMLSPAYRSVTIGPRQSVPILILHYREYSIGYSSPSEHRRISWGFRGKLYYGKGVFSSEITGSIQNVDGNYIFKTSGKGKMSLPEQKVQNGDGTISSVPNFSGSMFADYLMNKENSGLGFDLGFKFKIKPKLTFSASVLDVGNIKWTNNLTSKNFQSESLLDRSKFTSNIENGKEIITKKSDQISFQDKLTNLFQIDRKQLQFGTTLPVTFYAGFNYQINPRVRINLVDRFVKVKNLNQNSLMLSANFETAKNISVSTGYSIIGDSYANIPLAVLFKRDFGQVYLGTDNLMSFISSLDPEYAGISIGANLYIFRKRNLYDAPNESYPYFKPKKIKRVINNGRIQKEKSEFGFPEQY
jgi:hypothetical protein